MEKNQTENAWTSYSASNSNEKRIIESSMSLKDDILTIKLGKIMKEQDSVSESTFKAKSKYFIQLNSDKLHIVESKIFTLENITNFNIQDMFKNKNGIEGYIEIK